MKTENKKQRFEWLPTLLIVWNIIDIIVHVAIDMAEPLRITGNIIGIFAALIGLFGLVKSYAPHLLGGAAFVVVILNSIHAFEYGFAIPMLVFIGVTLFLLLRWAQVRSSEANTENKNMAIHFYYRWWMALIVSLVGVGIVILSGLLDNTSFVTQEITSTIVTQEDTSQITPGSNDTDIYTTVNAAEHADYGRSHVFEYATFGGSLDEDASNQVVVRTLPGFYPATYNIVTRYADEIFIYFGVYGDIEGSTGPTVARVDANTHEEVWSTQLAVYGNETAWNYPGVIGLHGNGMLVVVSGNTVATIDPDTGTIINQADLPQVDPVNASYNGFVTTSDGTVFTKALFRTCDEPGGLALARCLDTEATQTLLAIDPVSLEIVTQVELPEFATGRIPIGNHDGIDYVYLPGVNHLYRYRWENQSLVFDEDWGLVSVATEEDFGAMMPNIVGDWAFIPVITGSDKPMPVWAISTRDSTQRYMIQPFEGLPTRVSFAVAHGAFDPASGLLYAADTGVGYISAITFDPETGFDLLWLEEQTTSVFMQLIDTADRRVMVTSDLKNFLVNPLKAKNEQVVFRDAATGRELARTGNLPRMSDGANISPGFGGRVYFPGKDGKVYAITIQSE
jgi:hypothetical protein